VRLPTIRLFPDIACALEGMGGLRYSADDPNSPTWTSHRCGTHRREGPPRAGLAEWRQGRTATPCACRSPARWQPRGYGRQEGPPDGKRHLSDDQRPRQRDRASRSSPHQLRHTLSHYWLANGSANAAAGSSRRKVGAKGVTACLIISGPRRTWLSAHESLTLRGRPSMSKR
jgi:hypothetical protein